MSELTLTVLRFGLLALLWFFVFSLAAVLRGDLFGTRVVSRVTTQSGRVGSPAAPAAAPWRNRPVDNIVVTSGRLAGTRIPLGDNDILIGRNADCHLVLDDDFSSGHHARIFPAQNGWGVEDLGSTNGTFVNGERVDSEHLRDGDQVTIGRTSMTYRAKRP